MESDALSQASERYATSGANSHHDQTRAYAALASLIDAVYCVDTAGRFTFVNTAFEAMTGYALTDLQGTPSTRLYGPEIKALFAERRRQVYSGATVSPYVETVLILKDGRRLHVELSVSSLVIEGQIAGRVVVLRDITARRQTEEQQIQERVSQTITELRQAHGLLKTLFATAPVGLGFWDQELRFVRVNERLAEINGLPVSAHIGKTPTELLPGIEHLDQIMTAWRQVMATGKPLLDVEVSGETPAAPKHRRYWREHFFPVSTDGEVIGLGAVVEEITAQKQAEKALHQAKAELEQRVAERTKALRQSQRRLRQLASYWQDMQEQERTRMARELHDNLAQILTGLHMNVSYLSEHLPTTSAVWQQHLREMAMQIEELSKSMHRLATELRPTVLDDLGLLAAIEWQLEQVQSRTGISYTLDMPDEDICLSRGRATALFRIFQEALSNVVRHAEASRITVCIARLPDTLRLRISDNGKGITPKQQGACTALGLLGMYERAALCGGEVTIQGIGAKGQR